MKAYFKPNPRGTGACCSFSVSSTGKNQGIYTEILRQKSWSETTKTGTFDSNKESKINLKFTTAEAAAMMIICQKQKGTVKFFHNTGTVTSSISFGVWEKDGEAKGISLSASKADKKMSIPFTFAEAFELCEWLRFALNRIFAADYSEQKKLFQEKNKTKVASTEIEL